MARTNFCYVKDLSHLRKLKKSEFQQQHHNQQQQQGQGQVQDGCQKIPRPPNAFMLYANENRKSMAQMHPTESNKEISKRLGNSWKALELHEKTKYFDRAKSIDMEHKKRYPNYVYNPKEARIRKAMREANRDRSLGASPMLPRPSARRPPPWMAHHEDQLMLSPLANMRAAMEGPVCGFPLGGGSGGATGMSAGGGGGGGVPYLSAPMAGYGKLDAQMPSGHPSAYLQESPLAQLQQQTEMWHHPFTESAPVRSSSAENPFMVTSPSPYAAGMQGGLSPLGKQAPPPQAAPEEALLPPLEPPPPPCAMTDPQQARRPEPDAAAFDAALSPMQSGGGSGRPFAPPPPPPFSDPGDMKNALAKADRASRKVADYAEDQMAQTHGHHGAGTEEIYLPLSCQTLLVPQELLDGSREYHQRYILAYFAQLERYEVFTVTGADNQSFPYVAADAGGAGGGDAVAAEATPRFIPTDVGFVPLAEHGVPACCGCGADSGTAACGVLDLTPPSARAAVACQTDD